MTTINPEWTRPNFCPIDGTALEPILCPDDVIRYSCKKCTRIYTRASYIDDPVKVHEWKWL